MKSIGQVLVFLLIPALSHAAEFSFSGFGTLAIGSVVSGDGFIADYPNLGVYEGSDLDLGQETRLGLQGVVALNEQFSGTVQVMSRASNDYDLDVEWLYITYAFSDEVNIQAGKMRMPVYYFSEFMDVGYAYPWVRVPSDTYSLDVTNFNGLKLNWSFSLGSLDNTLSIIGGNEEEQDSDLMSYLFEGFTTNVNREFEDIVGVALDSSYGNLTARLSYTQADLIEIQTLRFAPGDATLYYDIKFVDVYVQYDFDSGLAIMAEYNEYDPFYKSYFASATYRINDWQPYILWSKFDLDAPFEEHDTLSIGVRYDLGDGIALKLDVSDFTDDGIVPIPGGPDIPNPVYHADDDGNGDATLLTFAVDFVF